MEDYWRNLLPIIASHATLQTCGRLKQVSHSFNNFLPTRFVEENFVTDKGYFYNFAHRLFLHLQKTDFVYFQRQVDVFERYRCTACYDHHMTCLKSFLQNIHNPKTFDLSFQLFLFKCGLKLSWPSGLLALNGVYVGDIYSFNSYKSTLSMNKDHCLEYFDNDKRESGAMIHMTVLELCELQKKSRI
jgi:hypothetical protein